MKKIICVLLSVLVMFSITAFAGATERESIDSLIAKFDDATGPEVNGVAIDYVSFSPETSENVKYPLVIWFHGMGQGSGKGSQIAENNFPLWASDEFQSRFAPSGGAFLFVPRSHEENKEYWSDNHIEAVKAAIDEFIAQNSEYIDLSRIYVGGFSMGGKMTLKMIISYPDFFAAAFPICPAYAPSDEEIKAVADMPIWLTVSKYDVIAGYFTYSEEIWNKICDSTNVPGDCRLSLMGKVCYGDGKKTPSNHHAWFAVSNDMFMDDGSEYINMTTYDASGKVIDLDEPDGMISWLSRFISDYNGEKLKPSGLVDNPDFSMNMVTRVLKALFKMFIETLKNIPIFK